MTVVLILALLLSPLMLVAGFYGGRLWADRQTPQLGKLREQAKLLRQENSQLQERAARLNWCEQHWNEARAQSERYQEAAESHELKSVPEFTREPFTEHFCGNATRLAATIKESLPGSVHEATAFIENEVYKDEIHVSGSPEKIGQDLQAFLEGASDAQNFLEDGKPSIFQVTISGHYRKPCVTPQMQLVTVIETLQEPVMVPVPQALPLEVQEFLDRYPENERLRLLEAAAEFRALEQPNRRS
jgi:hypothetical protein